MRQWRLCLRGAAGISGARFEREFTIFIKLMSDVQAANHVAANRADSASILTPLLPCSGRSSTAKPLILPSLLRRYCSKERYRLLRQLRLRPVCFQIHHCVTGSDMKAYSGMVADGSQSKGLAAFMQVQRQAQASGIENACMLKALLSLSQTLITETPSPHHPPQHSPLQLRFETSSLHHEQRQ